MKALLLLLLSACLQAQTANELRRVPAAEAHQGIASDARFLYAIDDSEIGKYDKATGKRVAGWKGDHAVFIHINSCSVIRAELVCAMSNFPQLPMASSVEWFSTATMKHLRSHSFGPLGPGSLTWIEWHDGSWYACFANYDAPRGDPTRDHNATVLVRYTPDFTPKESWLFPKNVLERFGHMSASGGRFGPDGLRGIGAQLSWLVPTPFYTEAFVSVMDGQGSTAFSFRNPGEPDATGVNRYAGRATLDRTLRGPQDLLVVPRLATSFELSDTQTVLAGVSAAFGPNDTGPHSRTEVYGADLFWKWKPANATQGFPYISWQTEALYRRFEAGADVLAGLPAETLRDYGFYSQVVYGFMPRWNVGLRADYVSGNSAAFDASDPYRGERTRFSPEITFLPSEFSKVRLQYNLDHGALFGTANSVWMQLEFGLGAHAAHKY